MRFLWLMRAMSEFAGHHFTRRRSFQRYAAGIDAWLQITQLRRSAGYGGEAPMMQAIIRLRHDAKCHR